MTSPQSHLLSWRRGKTPTKAEIAATLKISSMKINRLSDEVKEALAAKLASTRDASLQDHISKVFPNADNNNNGTGITTTPGTPTVFSHSSTSARTDSGTSDAQHSAGRSGNDSRRIEQSRGTSPVVEGDSGGTEPGDNGTAKRNTIGAVTINRVNDPSGNESSRGNDGRRQNDRQDTRDTGTGNAIPAPVVVGKSSRKPKSEPISEAALAFGVQSIFAVVGTVAGPHWAIPEENCKAIAEPLKKCLDKLPASTTAKIERYTDPLAVVFAVGLAMSIPVQVELAIQKGQVPRGYNPFEAQQIRPEPAVKATVKEPEIVQNNTAAKPSANGTGKSRFGDRFTQHKDVSGIP